MPPVRYYNQTAPFWDFVASLEEQSSSHPFFAGDANRGEATNNNEHSDEHEHEHGEPAGPWAGAWGPWGPFAHRGRHGPPPPGPPPHHHGGPPPHHRGGPPPHHHDGPPPPPPPADRETDGEAGPSDPPEMSPEDLTGPYHGPGSRGHGRHGRRGGPHGARGRADRCGRGRRGGFPPGMGALGPFGPFAEAIQAQIQNSFFGGEQNEGSSDDFKPEVDVFDTTEAFVVHVSLPGTKKEDIGVNWNAEKSELNIAGVIHRPGDEDFLKTLALNERRVGAFERNVRLGSRANPAQVDVDAISAKMEDGVLRIEVPKLDAGYVEIKKVDIE